jgi:hypothetical protein
VRCLRCNCVILGDGTEDNDFRDFCEDCEIELEEINTRPQWRLSDNKRHILEGFMKSELFELPILICLFLTAVALFGDDLANSVYMILDFVGEL